MSEGILLLIGARGFLGRHFLERTEAEGLSVVAADRSGAQGPRCDLLDPASISECIQATRPDRIVNLAGAASVAASWEDPAAAFALNATAVLHLLEAAFHHAPEAHILCLSSAEVYGEPAAESLPLAEGSPLQPLTPYGAGKAAMEAICGQCARGRGQRIAVIRAFNLLGPGQPPAYAASGFARQIAAAEAADAPRLALAVGNRAAARDFTDVRDAARALVAVSKAELTGAYNLCSGKPTSIEALIGELAQRTPLALELAPDPSLSRPADPSEVYGDPALLREASGWAPQVPLPRALADLLDWWRGELAAT